MRAKKGHRRKTKRAQSNEKKKLFFLVFSLLIVLFIIALSMRNEARSYYDHQIKIEKPSFEFTSDLEQVRIDSVIARNAHQTFGIDLSHNQKEQAIDWDSLQIVNGNIPISFVIIRATMGTNGKDQHFDAYWADLQGRHVIRGAYHYYRPSADPVGQANWFIKNVNFQKGDLRPILDVEVKPKSMSLGQFQKNLKTWLILVENATGRKPIIYTFYSFYRDYLKDQFTDYPTWIANYNDVLAPGENDEPWEFWQFAEHGNVNRIEGRVDLNVFHGSRADLRRYTLY